MTVLAQQEQIGQQLGAQALVRQVVKMPSRGAAFAALRTIALAVGALDVAPVIAREIFRVAPVSQRAQLALDYARAAEVFRPLRH